MAGHGLPRSIPDVYRRLQALEANGGGGAIQDVEAIATADASDPTTTQALANECKAKINEILAALKG